MGLFNLFHFEIAGGGYSTVINSYQEDLGDFQINDHDLCYFFMHRFHELFCHGIFSIGQLNHTWLLVHFAIKRRGPFAISGKSILHILFWCYILHDPKT